MNAESSNLFNLVENAWIPIADRGLASLREVFASDACRALGGTAREKIALLKLLLAIAQAAATPEDEKAWAALGVAGMGEQCLAYLERQREAFNLYGERPFLQLPAVAEAKLQPYGAIIPEVAAGNTSVLTGFSVEPASVPHARRALLLVCEMSLALGGKKADKNCILTRGVEKKTAPGGPGVCSFGLLHSFLTGYSVRETVWLNLLSSDIVADDRTFPEGVGVAPWEVMPAGENCETARKLKGSLMGRLVPLARFCLLDDKGLHYTEGIRHPDYLAGVIDPSVSRMDTSGKPRMLWVDPEKRPWRSLAARLSFMSARKADAGFDCPYLREGIRRLRRGGVERFGIWSGGLRVSGNAGEQYVSGTDDMVESELRGISRRDMENEHWFDTLQAETEALEKRARLLFGCIMRYYKEFTPDSKEQTKRVKTEDRHGADMATQGTRLFWEQAEPLLPQLLRACRSKDALPALQRDYNALVLRAFDAQCPHVTPRQIAAWASTRPFAPTPDGGTKPSQKEPCHE